MKKERVLLLSRDESYLVEKGKDMHTKSGVIRAVDTKRWFGKKIKSHLGKEFSVVKPNVKDILEKLVNRTAQVMLPKDLSLVLGYTGVPGDGFVIDAGTGTGYSVIFIANYIPKGKIVTYEKDKRFFKNAKRNIELSGFKNIKMKSGDVTKGISEKNADLIILDLQDADKAVKHAYKSLIYGGYLAVYSPTIDHLTKVLKAVRSKNFIDIKTVENIVREWQTERTVRPKTIGLMHTGFLTFARKVM